MQQSRHNADQQQQHQQHQQRMHADVGMPVTPQHRPQHIANIDPAIAGASMISPSDGGSGDDGSHDARKGKRELSTSKRAAQNREAQVSLACG